MVLVLARNPDHVGACRCSNETTGEFSGHPTAVAGGGFLLGAWRAGLLIGIVVAAALMILPIFLPEAATGQASQRLHKPTARCPDAAGRIVARRLWPVRRSELVAREVPEPAAKEFQRVMWG